MNGRKRLLLVYNPKAGKDRTRVSSAYISKGLSVAYNVTVKETTCAGDAVNIAKNGCHDFDVIVACGGDGTLNEVINGVLGSGGTIPIGYIPIGSTNDLATTIGLSTQVDSAINLINIGCTNTYDMGCFNGRFFTYVASFGAGVALSFSTPQRMKNILGHKAYIINGFVIHAIPILASLRPTHMRIEYDGNVIEDDFFFGAVSNSCSVAGMFKYDPTDIRLNDGLYEVLLVRGLQQSLEAYKMFYKIIKRDYDGKYVLYFKARNLKITSEKPVVWTLDGEDGGEQTDVDISVVNKACKVISAPNKLFI